MSVRLPRVAAKLGADFQDLRAEDLRRACAEGVAEDLHLDFKAEDSYTSKPAGLDELAKDVTALANAQGGLLVIGIVEDDQGNAAALKPLDITKSDDLIGKMEQGLRARVAPLYPAVAIRAVEDHDTPGRGVLLIGVPRSPLAPHAVRRTTRPEYSYALRVGRNTAWLEETEIANRYRDRFRLAEDHVARVREVFNRGVGTPPEAGDVANAEPLIFLELAAVPAVPAERRVDEAFIGQMAGFYGSLVQNTPDPDLVRGFIGRMPVVQRGRLSCDHNDVEAAWYTDGSSFIRVLVGFAKYRDHVRLNYSALELRILSLLQIAAAYADWAGAYGDIDVLARTVGARTVYPDLYAPAQQHAFIDRVTVRRSSNEPTHLTASLHSVVGEPTQLLSCAYSIAADLLADYGQPETTLIKSDGSVRWQRMGAPGRNELHAWLNNVGLVSD
ncbi:AlbA family DNA-binding domain-containing protein [Amycolatopsis kentuckyensis]|uniref:AlbA family DNA-binding domain-containing protein n=1 Tax=Amycolatopsis kentuckyensis TaxID=218823 RepID=UPI003565A5D0